MQDLTDQLGRRFVDLVVQHRNLDDRQLEDVATARVYLADEALRAGLIDGIGYLEDALDEAKELAGLPQDARVVVYRRAKYPDDNLYNTATVQQFGNGGSIVNVELPDSMSQLQTGFYYLWAPGLD